MTDLTPGPSAPFSADRASVRIRFVGFWDGFDPRDNFFTRLLAPRWRLDFDGPPDFILYTTVGSRRKEFLEYDCTRIFFTGENVGPDWLNCDWAFTFRHDSHPRHLRLPLWVLYADPRALVKQPVVDVEGIVAGKTRFCAFVVSNPLCRTRNDFFHKLSRYRPVDSGGKLFNNVGGRVADKRAFLADCRFTIAFENESFPGYTTEKVLEPMLARRSRRPGRGGRSRSVTPRGGPRAAVVPGQRRAPLCRHDTDPRSLRDDLHDADRSHRPTTDRGEEPAAPPGAGGHGKRRPPPQTADEEMVDPRNVSPRVSVTEA